MPRTLIYALALLHLGPGIAFALLAFGCDPASPYFETLCEGNPIRSFALLTALGWLILGTGLGAARLVRRARHANSPSPLPRAWALLALLLLGALVTGAGVWLTGSQYWFLAIPSSLAAGWLQLANPAACEPCTSKEPK